MKHYNLTSLPGLQNVENSNSSDLEALLLQMATDAETAALNPEAVVKTELTESEYEKYKIFQGIRHAFLDAINDDNLPSDFRASLVDELISLQSKNPLMYLDKCRHTLRSLIKERTSGGIVFTETREREINSILQVINLKKEHVIIEGATGLGKTVLAEAAVKRYLIQNNLFSTNSESNLEIDEVLKQDIQENLKETEYDFDGNFIMMNAAASTYEQLFGQIHIRKSDEGDVAETRFVPGIIYLAAEKGLPVILEEYNTVKDARVLKGLQTLMSADASSEITLELDPESGKVMTIRPKSGFTMVLTGNPLSKGAEGLTGVQKEDSAISSRCTRLIINQLPENELLQQFLVSQSLLDSNLGVNLPAMKTTLKGDVDLTFFVNNKGQTAYNRQQELLRKVRIGGLSLDQKLQQVINSSGYKQLSDPRNIDKNNKDIGGKAKLLRQVVKDYHTAVEELIIKEARSFNSTQDDTGKFTLFNSLNAVNTNLEKLKMGIKVNPSDLNSLYQFSK